MTLASATRAQAKIAEERGRIYAAAVKEVDAEWERKFAVAEQEAAEDRAWMEVQRERRAAAQARVEARETEASEEDESMAIATTSEKQDVTPFSKEAQIHGRKKPGAAARIKAEQKAVADREKSRGIAQAKGRGVAGPRANSAAGKARAAAEKPQPAGQVKTVAAGDAKLLPNNAAAAKKSGVTLVESNKVPGTYFVWVAGTRDRAISGRLASKSVAEAAIKRLGLHVAK